MLGGSADGGVGAYAGGAGTAKRDWGVAGAPPPLSVGLLSIAEAEQPSGPLCDGLKTPGAPVWVPAALPCPAQPIPGHAPPLVRATAAGFPLKELCVAHLTTQVLHGGAHFTLVFAAGPDDAVPMRAVGKGADPPAPPPLELYHWNGLPPGGPRMSKLQVTATRVAAPAPPTCAEGRLT
jgi:hypothetical protein